MTVKKKKYSHGKLQPKIPKVCCQGKGNLIHNQHSLYFCELCGKDWYIDPITGEVKPLK